VPRCPPRNNNDTPKRACHDRVGLGAFDEPLPVGRESAAFGGKQETRAKLDRLGSERKRCEYAAPVHDAAGGNDRNLQRIDHLRHERHQSDERQGGIGRRIDT